MIKYTAFISPTATGYSAHVPDLPGCVAAAKTVEETRQLIREAIEFHIEGMRMDGEAIPEPTPRIEQIEVSAQSKRWQQELAQLVILMNWPHGQVGEWLKPTDCKSVTPCELRRFESFPVHQESF